MIEKIKAYLGITDNSKDSLLNILMENAEVSFEAATNRPAADHSTVILKMVVEDFNRHGSEGIASLSFGSGSETILEDYSAGLQKQIRKLKRIRVL